MSTPSILGHKGRTIFEPNGGWKERTYYLCEVAFCKNNMIHRALFYSGFLNGNKARTAPGGYNGFLQIEGPDTSPLSIDDAYYLKPLFPVFDDELNLIARPQQGKGEE